MADDDFDDVMTDADFEAAIDQLKYGDTEEIGELLKLMNEHQIISWEEAERIMGDTSDVPVKSSLPPQTRPTEPENDTNVNETIQKLLNNDPKLTQINLNNMKRTPIPQIKRIIEAMRKNTYIEKLCLANLGLYDHDVDNLIDVIQVNESLKHINLETNYLGGDFFSGLFQAALTNETLEEVKCVNQGVSFPTDKEKEIIKAIQQNTGLLKVSINLRLPEGRHKIENALIRNQDIRRELRRRQRLAEAEAAKNNPEPLPEEKSKPKGVAPYIPADRQSPPKKKIIEVPKPPEPEKIQPPPKKLIDGIPKKIKESSPPKSPVKEPKKVYRRMSNISQTDLEQTSKSPESSPVKKAPPKEDRSFSGNFSVKKSEESQFFAIPLEPPKKEKTPLKEDYPPYVPHVEPPKEPIIKKEKKIPPVDQRNPVPMGVFPRNKIPSFSKNLTSEDEESRANSAMSNRTEDSESEKPKPPESSATPSDADKPPEISENGSSPKKKKIIKKKIIKKIVKKKEKPTETNSEETSNITNPDTVVNNHTESDSQSSSKIQNQIDTESEKEPENDSTTEKKIPPPVLPKTTRVSSYSGYTPSSSGYNNSRYGGYSSRYSHY